MKNKIIMFIIVGQLAFISGVDGQTVGISSATGFIPLSTLDVNGSVGLTITENTAITPTSSTVLYNNTVGQTTTITLPNPVSYTNRIYIITNASLTAGATAWAITANAGTPAAGFYYNLSHVQTYSVAINLGIMIISDGTNWLQIR